MNEPPTALVELSSPGEALSGVFQQPARTKKMNDNRFELTGSFLQDLVERYHEDQNRLFEVLQEDAIRNPRKVHFNNISEPLSEECMLKHIKELIEVSFWASLRKEEGRHHSFAVLYSPPTQDILGNQSARFRSRPAFDAEILAKLAPALESTGTIGVWPKTLSGERDRLEIWGVVPPLRVSSSLLIKAIEPGQIILWISDMWRASITGLKAEFVDSWPFRDLFTTVLPQEHFLVDGARNADLERISIAMRAHGHGGILLIIPKDEAQLGNSIEMGIFRLTRNYEKGKSDLENRDAVIRQFASGRIVPEFDAAFKSMAQSVENIARLTAVDGATLVTPDLAVLAFGAKILPQKEEPDLMSLEEPFEKNPFERRRRKRPKKFSEMTWGTRHKSGARFVFNHPGVVAIVASSDGRLSVFKREGAKLFVLQHAEFLWL
jgi:hypothetical protein